MEVHKSLCLSFSGVWWLRGLPSEGLHLSQFSRLPMYGVSAVSGLHLIKSIHATMQSCIHSVIQYHSIFLLFVPSFIPSCIHAFIHSFVRSFLHSFSRSTISSFIDQSIRCSLVHSFDHLFIHWFADSLIFSLVR